MCFTNIKQNISSMRARVWFAPVIFSLSTMGPCTVLKKCLLKEQMNEWSYLSLTVALEGRRYYFLVTNEVFQAKKDSNKLIATHVLHLHT